MKHISKITENEMLGMQMACIDAAIKYSNRIGTSGLSHNGWFNFYSAIQDAIRGEWEKAKSKPLSSHDR